MKHETPTIAALPRERKGSRYAQRLRKSGRLPGVIYGHRTDPVSVSVDEGEIVGLLKHGTHVMYVDIDGGKTETCLVKDLQFGYLGDNVIHVDFTRVDLEEEVTVNVHLAFVGTPAEANLAGAIVEHDRTELSVKCKVNAIPENIPVDLSTMEGLQLFAEHIPLPDELVLAEEDDTLIVSISFVKKVEEVGEEAEVEAGAEEPEVISEGEAEPEAKSEES